MDRAASFDAVPVSAARWPDLAHSGMIWSVLGSAAGSSPTLIVRPAEHRRPY